MNSASVISKSHIERTRFYLLKSCIFAVGFSAMLVAGWYLIEGMLHFAGDDASKRTFIAAGIIFQITESICFIAAAALTNKSFQWRIGLFLLGVVLFFFSITVMTLAQKATLQSGENQAQAIDLQIKSLNSQMQSLDNVIGGYRLNADRQSKSIYANSRELGQDSLNRATDLEQKKITLANELFDLNNKRKQTSSDFFEQLESFTGYPATQMEFYFLITRSLLLELCGIMLLAFAAQFHPHKVMERIKTKTTQRDQGNSKLQTQTFSPHDTSEHWAKTHIRLLKQKSGDGNTT